MTLEPGPRGREVRSFVGASEFNDESTAESFHDAVKDAAREAARVLQEEGAELPQAFEVSRVRILVGNPNVKVYEVTITHGGGS
jgi:hypothetical protein